MEKDLFFVRHGLIRSNVQDIYSGRSNEELTQSGLECADQLGHEIEGWGITVIYTSPLTRTLQTAEALNRHINARLILEPKLLEMDLGPWTGLSKAEVALKYPLAYKSWVETPGEFNFDSMETLRDIQRRTISAVNVFLDGDRDRAGIMVTHAAVIKVAFLYFNNLDLNSYHSVSVPNLCVYRIGFNKEISFPRVVRVK